MLVKPPRLRSSSKHMPAMGGRGGGVPKKVCNDKVMMAKAIAADHVKAREGAMAHSAATTPTTGEHDLIFAVASRRGCVWGRVAPAVTSIYDGRIGQPRNRGASRRRGQLRPQTRQCRIRLPTRLPGVSTSGWIIARDVPQVRG